MRYWSTPAHSNTLGKLRRTRRSCWRVECACWPEPTTGWCPATKTTLHAADSCFSWSRSHRICSHVDTPPQAVQNLLI